MTATSGHPTAVPAAPRRVRTPTHCPHCALQCGLAVTVTPGSRRLPEITPRDFPTNRGRLCPKGWTAGTLLTAPDRLLTPLARLRPGAALTPVEWDGALDTVAERLREIRAEHGPGALAVFGGGGLTNETAYALGKFARIALGTAQIDHNGRFCTSAAAAAALRAFGLDRGLPFPVADLDEADAVLLVGANVAETMPPFLSHLQRSIAAGGLVVVDPRRTPTAEKATLHLAPVPGTDLALALGLLHVAVVDGHVDHRYTERRTRGLTAAWRLASRWWPERVERVTGVTVALQRAAVRVLATAERAFVLTGRGAEQNSRGTDTVSAFVNLALALGLPGRGGSGFGSLAGQGNGQGAREHGQAADQLPGYRRLDDPAARAHVAAVWGVDPDRLPVPGRTAYDLLDSLGTPGGPRALLVAGSNPVVSAPRAAHVQDRLASLDLLVVADVVPTETTALADVILPVTQWAEEDGTLTGLDGRVVRRRRALPPPPGPRTDLEILHGLAVRLGEPPDRFPSDARAVFAELRRASAGGPADYSGITWERLDAGEALHWPCPETTPPHRGTPRLFLTRFATADGRARFVPVDHRPAAEEPDGHHPLYATTGRVVSQAQSGAQTRRVPELLAAEPECFVEVHPDTAARHGLRDGGRARVVGWRGTVVATVRLVSSLRPDTVFLPVHFPGDGRANLLTNPALDPVSGMPELKLAVVRLEPVDRPRTGPPG
jgi:assimilatory nitrate reductase catalytic subunit